MPLQIQGNGGVVADVDGTTFRPMRTKACPDEYGAFGHYHANMTSGAIAAALAASGVVFAFRWGDATRICVVRRIEWKVQSLTAFTAATTTDFGFDVFSGRSYTASHTGGTAATLTGNSFKKRTTMGTTLLTDMRMATTAALGGGTITLDAQPFAASVGARNIVNPAAATEYIIWQPANGLWQPSMANGDYPLVYAQNEGFVIRNRTVWPAAGTAEITVSVDWSEYTAY